MVWQFRQMLIAIAALGAVLLGVGSVVQSAAPERTGAKDWPLFRGDATASGTAATKLPDKLEKVWEFKVDGGAFDSTAAIVDGVVYIGDMDGEVWALSLADGKEIWKFETDSGFLAAPAVRDGLIYIGDIDGKCYCIDAKSGKEKWHFLAEAEVDSSANFWQ